MAPEVELESAAAVCKSPHVQRQEGLLYDGSPIDRFAQLQAILACMPMHALGEGGCSILDCGYCTSRSGTDRHSAVAPVDRAVLEATRDYPEFANELGSLRIAHCSMDMVCFVDHGGGRLFTAIRGTDTTMPRDLGNDVLIALGFSTWRTEHVQVEYRAVRDTFSTYRSYGCGHSLGGTIMHELAYSLGDEPKYAFTRVDVFNAGGSPFRQSQTPLLTTEFFSHRVVGDLVSYFYEAGGRTVLYNADPEHNIHLMGHFLPPKGKLDNVVAQIVEAQGLSDASWAALGQWRLTPAAVDGSIWPFLNLVFG